MIGRLTVLLMYLSGLDETSAKWWQHILRGTYFISSLELQCNFQENHGCQTEKQTWGTHPADERGCEALASHENTRDPLEITRNTWSSKWTGTHGEKCWGIKSYQGWHLTPGDFIKLDFKKSLFSRSPRFWQNGGGVPASVVGFRTCSGHSWNLRWKSWWLLSRIIHLDTNWFLKFWFPMVLALLREDLLISQL